MKKNTLKRFMASAMTAVMCVSSLGTLAVNAAPADLCCRQSDEQNDAPSEDRPDDDA